jgi:hypothetical protein
MGQFKKLGMTDVRRQDIAMRRLWYPMAWSAEFTVGGKITALKSVFPITESPPTGGDGITAPVWVGLGTAADFPGCDVAGKPVMIYSIRSRSVRDVRASGPGLLKSWC